MSTSPYELDLGGLVTGALSLVAALAWNEAAKKGITNAFPFNEKDSFKATLAYALIVTVLIVVLFGVLRLVFLKRQKEDPSSVGSPPEKMGGTSFGLAWGA